MRSEVPPALKRFCGPDQRESCDRPLSVVRAAICEPIANPFWTGSDADPVKNVARRERIAAHVSSPHGRTCEQIVDPRFGGGRRKLADVIYPAAQILRIAGGGADYP